MYHRTLPVLSQKSHSKITNHCVFQNEKCKSQVGWSPTSGRRMSGTSRPSLRHKGFALISFISKAFQDTSGNTPGGPSHFLPDVGDRPSKFWYKFRRKSPEIAKQKSRKKITRRGIESQRFGISKSRSLDAKLLIMLLRNTPTPRETQQKITPCLDLNSTLTRSAETGVYNF